MTNYVKANIHSKIWTILHLPVEKWSFLDQKWARNEFLLLRISKMSIDMGSGIVHWYSRLISQITNTNISKENISKTRHALKTLTKSWRSDWNGRYYDRQYPAQISSKADFYWIISEKQRRKETHKYQKINSNAHKHVFWAKVGDCSERELRRQFCPSPLENCFYWNPFLS